MKDAHQKSKAMSPATVDASTSSVRLFQGCISAQNLSFGGSSFGKSHSLASISLALSLGATGLLATEPQAVQATEAATLPTSQANRLFSQGETFMIPAPVTLATAPEAQPVVESSQLVAAVSSNSVSRVEPELPAIKHIVAETDTFWSIAQRYNVPVEAIAKLNNLTVDSALTVGQAIKIPPQFNNQPVAAVTQQFTPPKASAEVAALQPKSEAVVKPESTLKIQQDEALSTLRAKQENLAASIKELRSQSTEVVVFDAEVDTPKPETLISSTAVNRGEPITAPTGSVIIPVPQPKEINEPVAKTEPKVETLIANNAIASADKLPEPPSLSAPTPTPELAMPRKEERLELSRSVTPTVPSTAASAPATIARANNEPVTLTVPPALTPTPTAVSRPSNDAVTLTVPPAPTLNPTMGRSGNGVETLNAFVPTSSNTRTHVVSRGETLYEIARRYGVSGRELIVANRLDNPNIINVNQQLVIPSQGRSPAQNSFVALLPQTEVTQPVNRESVTLASAASLSRTEIRVDEPVSTSFEVSTESAVNQLKSDIARMRQEYQPVAIAPKAPAVEMAATLINVPPAAVNPEWQGRQTANVPTQQIEEVEAIREAPQEIAAASREDIVNYNSLLRLSVGEVVAPDLPPLASPDEYLPGSQVFAGYIWPAQGTFTSGYGQRWGRMHKGIDIAAPVGTPIFAAAGGEVVSAGWNSGGYGNLVEVRHSDGSLTRYAHNSRIMVRKGQEVKQGQQIASMGSTGFSTGPHLHFEIHPKGKGATNPVAFLPKK